MLRVALKRSQQVIVWKENEPRQIGEASQNHEALSQRDGYAKR